MKIFVIRKYDDDEAVSEKLDFIRKECPDAELVLLEKSSIPHWKNFAYERMKEADCAVFFIGEKAQGSKNITWELKKFKGLGKPIYTIALSEGVHYDNKILHIKSTFGNKEIMDDKKSSMYSRDVQLEQLAEIIKNNLESDVCKEIFTSSEAATEVSIEQYKAYLQTSENVVERRQAVSNFYITVNATLISILSAVVTLINVLGQDYSMAITIVGCYLVPVLGVILCYNWRRLVYSYGQLNAAKMKVISAIEKSLPYNIYDVEWKIQTERLGKRKYISFTNIEKQIPILFTVTYCLIFIAAVVLTFVYCF